MKRSIVGKIVLATLGLVLALAVVIFTVMSLAFPATVAGWCESTGSYSFAVSFASLHYKYTGDVEDAARCAQDSILSENDNYIIRYGVQFIDHEDFDSYCSRQDEYYTAQYATDYSYRQYIYGEIACTYYAQDNTSSAIGTAIQALDADYNRTSYTAGTPADCNIQSFADGNALIALSLDVIKKYDGVAAAYIVDVLEGITCEDGQQQKLAQFTAIMQSVADGTY